MLSLPSIHWALAKTFCYRCLARRGKKSRMPAGCGAALLVAQGDQRVHPRGAAGWQIAGEERDAAQDRRYGGEGQGVAGRDREEEAREEAGDDASIPRGCG